MTGRPVLVAGAALALCGCSQLHLPYLPHDRPFAGRDAEAAATAASDRRVDPVQSAQPHAAGQRPPCKFGGLRCPPWERAWPVNSGLTPADRVTDTGEVLPPRATGR